MKFSIIWVAVSMYSPIYTYPTGKIESACSTLEPSHSSSPQSGAPPFKVEVSSTKYCLGSKVKVEVIATGGELIKGFIMQPRTQGGSSAISGGWPQKPDKTQTIACEFSGTTMSHTQRLATENVWGIWQPAGNSGSVEFLVTVVVERKTYYTKLKSAAVSYQSSCSGIPEPTPGPTVINGAFRPGLSVTSVLLMLNFFLHSI